MEKERLNYLIDRSLRKLSTPEEQKELDDWYGGFEESPGYTDQLSPSELDELYSRMVADFDKKHIKKKTTIRRILYGMVASAAILAVMLVLGTHFYGNNTLWNRQVVSSEQQDILPGENKARLTLPDGRVVDLLSEQSGIIIGDELLYDDGSPVHSEYSHHADHEAIPYLSLATPRGGTYQITLPDGSRVWLNADSRLRYPVRFTGAERVVELEGEAYFEVQAVNQDMQKAEPGHGAQPFIVKTAYQTVEVMGTAFNISAYPDEAGTKTTLVNGKVNVVNTESHISRILSPGQQSTVLNGAIDVREVAVAPHIAWKEGDFIFENEPLESIMKKLSRWYNTDVVYEGDPTGLQFYGMVSRSKNISTVLKVMELTGKVKFKVENPDGTNQNEGRRVVVMR